jgi:hypothetical protein
MSASHLDAQSMKSEENCANICLVVFGDLNTGAYSSREKVKLLLLFAPY